MSIASGQQLDIGTWNRVEIAPGQRKRFTLEMGNSFSGAKVKLPVMVWRANEPGPVLGITSAIHGDEVNGTGAIRSLIKNPPFRLIRGALILVPVINIPGFERHSRYMPDRRDLNRSFPGSTKGSFTSRLARLVFSEIVGRCDYIVDLHTAAVRRTNFPNVRADYNNEDCARLARTFGCEVVVNGAGPDGSFRKEAVKAGCPTIVIEAGEVWKVEPAVLEMHRRGITNILVELGMVDNEPQPPPHQIVVEETTWVRAEMAGLLRYHVAPGEPVSEGQIIATSTSLLGADKETIRSPHRGIVMGMSTMPAVNIGDPVFHIALPATKGQQRRIEKSIGGLEKDTIELDIRSQLATNINVTEQSEE